MSNQSIEEKYHQDVVATLERHNVYRYGLPLPKKAQERRMERLNEKQKLS